MALRAGRVGVNPADVDSNGHVKVKGGGVSVVTKTVWDSLPYPDKKMLGTVCIQDETDGFDLGKYVDASQFFEIAQSDDGSDEATITSMVEGDYNLLVIAINSEASTKTLITAVKVNDDSVTGSVIKSNNYNSSAADKRNYVIAVYPVNVEVDDVITATLTGGGSHSSLLIALTGYDVKRAVKTLSSADGGTTGTCDDNCVVVYGTAAGGTGGTINGTNYVGGTTINTGSPGSSYKSSYIFWLDNQEEE